MNEFEMHQRKRMSVCVRERDRTNKNHRQTNQPTSKKLKTRNHPLDE